ncbi:unnamed protein product [Umbelopsis ramanniana]
MQKKRHAFDREFGKEADQGRLDSPPLDHQDKIKEGLMQSMEKYGQVCQIKLFIMARGHFEGEASVLLDTTQRDEDLFIEDHSSGRKKTEIFVRSNKEALAVSSTTDKTNKLRKLINITKSASRALAAESVVGNPTKRPMSASTATSQTQPSRPPLLHRARSPEEPLRNE